MPPLGNPGSPAELFNRCQLIDFRRISIMFRTLMPRLHIPYTQFDLYYISFPLQLLSRELQADYNVNKSALFLKAH